jgi:hypothetical protein
MFMSIASVALALQLSGPLPNEGLPVVEQVQYGVPVHAPPCGNGWDISARNGMCYPNGYLPPQEQAARRYRGRYYGGGRYPVPCGNGADIDIRDGQCYPNGTVPRRYQEGRRY